MEIEESNNTLHRIENNDPKLDSLYIVYQGYTTSDTGKGYFWVLNETDVSKLGNAIGNNTHLKKIEFFKSSKWTSQLNTNAFFEGLNRNTTINDLNLIEAREIGIGNEIISKYAVNNSNLTDISIHSARGGVTEPLGLKKCPNLDHLTVACDIDDVCLKAIASGIRGLSCLQKLVLWETDYSSNSYTSIISIEGAESIATVLQDPSCNLIEFDLNKIRFCNELLQKICSALIGNTKLENFTVSGSSIGTSGYESIATLLENPTCNLTEFGLSNCGLNSELVTTIVRSLMNNTKLDDLDLSNNNIGRSGCESIATLLQNPNSNIDSIGLASCKIDDDCAAILAQALIGNNKLECLKLSENPGITESGWNAFSTILTNCSNHTLCSFGRDYRNNKDFVIKNMPTNLASLLKLNLPTDMEPLFELNSEDDDERKPKALPSVIDWFSRVRESNQNMEVVKCIDARKLSTIFQFARAMPLRFVSASHFTHPSVNVEKKRKYGL